jgi:hypothetical protein
MQSISVQVLEHGRCKLGVVAHWAFGMQGWTLKDIGLLGFTRIIWRWCWIPKMHLLEQQIMISIDPSFGSTCGRQDGNNVIVLFQPPIYPPKSCVNQQRCEQTNICMSITKWVLSFY